jgi:hypothetical protein
VTTPVVARGRWTPARVRLVVIAGFVVACLALLVTFLATERGYNPLREKSDSTTFFRPGRIAIVGELVCAVLAFAVQRALWARAGSAELRDDSLVFTKTLVTEVAWADVLSFSDDAAGYVQLDVKGRTGMKAWSTTIPTPDEATRTAMLASLIERGLTRR